jgi:hypothetical protein
VTGEIQSHYKYSFPSGSMPRKDERPLAPTLWQKGGIISMFFLAGPNYWCLLIFKNTRAKLKSMQALCQ